MRIVFIRTAQRYLFVYIFIVVRWGQDEALCGGCYLINIWICVSGICYADFSIRECILRRQHAASVADVFHTREAILFLYFVAWGLVTDGYITSYSLVALFPVGSMMFKIRIAVSGGLRRVVNSSGDRQF